ncbi:unnamed protein product [Brachionus calyciflorus]|uniref:Uncharacterized protein n=1 Tax=Brachionus calyciflorus TaxID=104777 RepID=A0A813M2J2_9BILA|nr:unnamed protein product [Brachionus calyciflorus]
MLKDDGVEFFEQLKADLEHRYTENDDEYMETCNSEKPSPPILKIIVNKRRSYYQRDERQDRFDYGGGHRPDHHQQRQRYHNDNRYQPYKKDNNRGHGHRGRGQRRYDQNYDQRRQYQHNDERSSRENEYRNRNSPEKQNLKRKHE